MCDLIVGMSPTLPATARLTKTQRRLFDFLADGEWHSNENVQLHGLGKRYAAKSLVSTHIQRLRVNLPEAFIIESAVGAGYRLVATETAHG